MEAIRDAIRHATEAARLRGFAQRNGVGDLADLADRHSRLAAEALTRAVTFNR